MVRLAYLASSSLRSPYRQDPRSSAYVQDHLVLEVPGGMIRSTYSVMLASHYIALHAGYALAW